MNNMVIDKKETYAVKGMSCTGCEGVIEKALMGLEGAKDVKASFSKRTVTVVYNPEQLNFGKIRAAVKKVGYTLEKAELKSSNNTEDKPLSVAQFIGIAIILLAAYLIIKNTVGFNFIPEVTSSMGYGVLFVVGLLTSLHCVAMCGGINMSQCVSQGGAAQGTKAKVKPSLLYNLGRVTSYTIIGGVVGAVGSVISFSGWARGLIAIISGIFMVIMGLSMTGLFPWINKITPRLPRAFRQITGSAGNGKGPYIVGLLNGLMPCGPLQAMQIYALGTGSFVTGALSMFFFSLGTLPLMFGLGAVITMLGNKFTKKMMKMSAVLVAVLGIVMLSRGLLLSGVNLPSFGTSAAAVSDTAEAPAVTIEDGVQNITSTLPSSGYPDITVQKGVPVVWNLQADASKINGCNGTLVISDFNLQVKLKAGDNIIKFTPTESGKITYSCWMGMQTGQIDVVDDLNGTSAQAASDDSSASGANKPSGGMSCCTGSSASN
jgi:sulfite exporter TauE/SafE/copper chaperone CopZ